MNTPTLHLARFYRFRVRPEKLNLKSSSDYSTILLATIIFGAIFIAIIVPPLASAQSWWDQIKKTGEQISEKVIDQTLDKSIPPSENQQQPEQTSQQQSNPNTQYSNHYSDTTYTKAKVRKTQMLLIRLGYQPGPVDGVYGNTTASAIRAYQVDQGLLETGKPSDELITQMQTSLTKHLATSKPEIPSSANPLQSHPQLGSQTAEIASQKDQMVKTNLLSLNYPNLLRLYIARHADLLNNEAFAWHYFQTFKAPEKRSLECSELKKKTRNPIRFAELVEREKQTFEQELLHFEKLPSSGFFLTPVTVQVGNYNPDLQSFPVTRVYVNYNKNLSFQPRCATYPAPLGPSYAPQDFAYGSVKMPNENELPTEIAISKEVAKIWLDDVRLSSNALSGRMNLSGVATVHIEPLPFIKDSSVISLKGEVVGLTVKDPLSGKVLYSYNFSDNSAGEETATANSGALMELSDASLMLYLIRDNPETMTPRVVKEITRRQVQAEQQYWRKIDDNLYSALNGSMGFSNLNSKQPLFAYQWQLLRQHNPSQAQELLKVFISSNESWQFYRNETNYDPRLGAFVEASIFSREAIGLPDAQTTLQKVKKANSRPSQKLALPTADYLLPELTPVMSDFLLQASQSVPQRFKQDFTLNGKFDPYAKRLLLSKDYSGFEEAKAISPLRSNERASFAENGHQLDSTLYLPLPMSAKNRFVYTLPYQSAPIQTRPGLSAKVGSTTNDWRRILASTRGLRDEKFGAVGGLALDREVTFSPVPVEKETVQRAQGERYRNAAVFPVIARLIVDVERMDMVRLRGQLGSQQQELRNGALLGQVVGLEVLDQSGALIHSIDVATLKSAVDVASAEQVAQSKAQATENRAREQQQQELSSRRDALRNADVIGIRPGMPVAEAEKIIREHMVVGWVGELADDAPGVRSPNRPYNYFRTFISNDGSEHVALYWHPEISNKLQGVTRTLVLPDKMSDEAVLTSLKNKYGTDLLVPSQKTPAWVWTVDFGASKRLRQLSNPTKEDRFRMGPCQASIQGKIRIRWLDILEGEPITSSIQRRFPSSAGTTASIRVNGGKSGTYKQPQWEVTQWKECGPTVSANVNSSNLGKVLEVGLFDLSTYGPVYDALMKKKNKEAENHPLTL